MVNLWPWKGDNNSAASFEKALSTLSIKITKIAARNDSLRQRARRVRVMWTLYAGFAYILTALILTLVTGWRSWGTVEYSVMAGGPVVVYLVRTSLTTYYDYRISNTQLYLNSLYKERDATIERLKQATKYNSTQQLLEKYGSPPPKPEKSPSDAPANRRKSEGPQKQGQRTNMPPPPTANIPRPGISLPSTPQRPGSAASLRPSSSRSDARSDDMPPPPPPKDMPGAEFAPNAFAPPELARQYTASSASSFTQSRWYDRILDVLLGEDETQPKNRLALICSECRLVNGQAPPGTRTLEDVGRWRCAGCRAWNGREKREEVGALAEAWEKEREAEKQSILEKQLEIEERGVTPRPVDADADNDGESSGASSDADVVIKDADTPARSTRSRVKSKGAGRKT
ncbi:uncharacterized protein BDZ99DRAFT_459812 [Mytilinidion resinicola]|uniref:Endoplasmic reticulum junction formation protein lunapark n=1 Tax=Mytilinidion resinicola TaxID=574789 RepID=A0A6A6YZ28_9PEZI|nr:uncharacterized protein BDZ99DRAFT_459812 [Mytilinidion resinicola]KAF2814081.1 hypothetical protein BDZ99DRAFT_459812 [Mytilinidion resinicola]